MLVKSEGEEDTTYVEVGEIDAPESQEGAESKERIWRFFESTCIEQRSSLSCLNTRSRQAHNYDCVEGDNGCHDEDRPSEPIFRHRGVSYSWKHHSSRGSTASRQRDGKGSFLLKIRRKNRHNRSKQEPMSKPAADTLRKEELPILCRVGGSEDANNLERTAKHQTHAAVSQIDRPSGKDTNKVEQKHLHGPYPRHIRS